ncbi:hypothetical protein DFJ74DRAFT_386526 [Hyaloraphidium curvatum]|nr:hypothetical protein DFJ74DRAFT_386526 [Hyaloraphidium curvatum]
MHRMPGRSSSIPNAMRTAPAGDPIWSMWRSCRGTAGTTQRGDVNTRTSSNAEGSPATHTLRSSLISCEGQGSVVAMQIRGPKLAMALLLVAFAALAAIGPAVASPVDRRALFTALPCPQLPVSTDGSCGPAVGLRCRDGFCCSGTGFCGAGDAWCTDTCQVGYGECHVSEQPLAVVCVTATSKATTATTRSGAPANSPGASTKTQPGPSSATRSTAGLLTTAPVNLPSGTSSPRPTPPPVPKSSWDGPQVGACEPCVSPDHSHDLIGLQISRSGACTPASTASRTSKPRAPPAS